MEKHSYDEPEQLERTWFNVYDGVMWFKDQMLRKLWHHRNKRFWMNHPDFDIDDAFERMGEERVELAEAMMEASETKEWGLVIDEAADVANFCLMVAMLAQAELDKSTKGGVQ